MPVTRKHSEGDERRGVAKKGHRAVGVITEAKGRTLIPLAIYFVESYAKVELAVASGKKEYDKRHAIAERESKREAERALAARTRGER